MLTPLRSAWCLSCMHKTSPRGWWLTEQVAQGGCGCPIPAGIQGQAGCGSGQPGLLVGDPAHSRGWNSMSIVGLFNPGHSVILWFLLCLWLCSEAASFIAGSAHWKASLCVYANKHTSILTHAEDDISVPAHRGNKTLIMHKHNKFL